jgi:photosystem II stability/assembly factor-like uncharacterized protein
MDNLLFVATAQGLAVCERQGDQWRETRRGLEGQGVTSVSARDGVALAGTRDGIWRSGDLGRSWEPASQGLGIRYVRWLAHHPAVAGLAFAGTEPAGIFVTRDQGATWRGCPEVEMLREEHGWFLPYSPGAGCVRAFRLNGSRVSAAVEIGGVLRSDDLGATWRLVEGSTGKPDFRAPVPRTQLHPDVHDVATIADSADALLAATMAGLYRSVDGGRKWLHLYADCYIRALWIDPADERHMVIGPADDVEINGQIEETRDAGWSWQASSIGLPTPWRRAVVEHLTPIGEELFAVISNGQLFAAPMATLEWRCVLAGLPQVTAVAALAQTSVGVA